MPGPTYFSDIKFFLENVVQTNEIELRFSERFMDGVSYGVYKTVIDMMTHDNEWTKQIASDVSIIGKDIRSGAYVRKIGDTQFQKKKGQYLRGYLKEIFNKCRVDLNIKLSSASEEDVDTTDEQFVPELIRNRERISFTHSSGMWRIDITRVSTVDRMKTEIEPKISFEIELEYLPSIARTLTIDIVSNIISKILVCIQGGVQSAFLTNKQIDIVLRNYAGLLKQNPQRPPYFAGPLPFTLRMQDLENGKISCGYSITDKADGQRYLLYLDDNKNAFFISRPKGNSRLSNSVSYVGEDSKNRTCILDGELVNNNFYVFDCLVSNKQSLMNGTPLNQRLEKAANIVLNNKQIGPISLHMKKFYLTHSDGVKSIKIKGQDRQFITKIKQSKDLFAMAGKIWSNKDKNKSYDLDGLIFTPIGLDYFNKEIYKWKPRSMQTIDFFIKKKAPQTFILHIASKDPEDKIYKNMTFGGIDGNGTFLNQYNQPIRNAIYDYSPNLTTGEIQVSVKNYNVFPDNSVIEFKWHGKNFIPLRTRLDKSFSNGIGATNDAWESIINPISLAKLEHPKYVSCIRKYHNKIKDHLVKNYTSDKTVLDIGSGRGGDIHKYIKHKSKYVVGVDIEDVEYNYPKDKMEFYKVADTEYSIKNLLVAQKSFMKEKLFDIVNCQFAAHYFFKNRKKLDNFISNVTENLTPNGLLILTFLNGDKVREFLENENIAQGTGKTMKSQNGKEVFRITREYKNNKSLVGDKIRVRLYGTVYFRSSPSVEYLIYPSELIAFMSEKGFRFVSQKQFDEYGSMFGTELESLNTPERIYSFMNVAMVFKKSDV